MKSAIGVYEFPWGTAVKNEIIGEWIHYYKASGREILIVEGLDVDFTEEGVIINAKNGKG